MVSVTSASRFATSASRYQPHYQSRSSMYIRGLIPRNFAELAEAVPIILQADASLYIEIQCKHGKKSDIFAKWILHVFVHVIAKSSFSF